jgi:hypothetical protein
VEGFVGFSSGTSYFAVYSLTVALSEVKLTLPALPPPQDVPLISLANILHNAKLWNDAVIVATMAVEIAPHFAVNHFTLGNVYVAMVRLGWSQLSPNAELDFKAYFEYVTLQFPKSVISKISIYTDRKFIRKDLRGGWVVVVVVLVVLLMLFWFGFSITLFRLFMCLTILSTCMYVYHMLTVLGDQ